jgi:TfoX/Sxy family transcriptional regulator of competence genes
MAYDEHLADRVRRNLQSNKTNFEEKKMMGGLTFMVNGKMCVGVLRDELMVRVDPAFQEKLLKKKGCREMDFTKRPMKGFLFIGPDGTDKETDLEFWLEQALAFNPQARSSKK